MKWFWLIVLGICLMTPHDLWGESKDRADSLRIKQTIYSDSIANTEERPSTKKFYDKLKQYGEKHRAAQWIYDAVIQTPPNEKSEKNVVLDEADAFKPFEGKTIASITIICNNIYPNSDRWIKNTANTLHIVSTTETIKRDLLFKEGDLVNADLVVQNKQLINSRNYIYATEIRFVQDINFPDLVHMEVHTRDKWSLNVDGSTSLDGYTSLSLYDNNILGMGNKLRLTANFDWSERTYGGTSIEYYSPNVIGTFINGRILIENNYDNRSAGAEMHKSFIKPTDYAMEIEYFKRQTPFYMQQQDSTALISFRSGDIWGGYSHFTPSLKSSIYSTTLVGFQEFIDRPEVSKEVNPDFHNQQYAVGSLGIYRERFLTSNLIYGYGSEEYIATGYKCELLMGYSKEEFSDYALLGGGFKQGGFSKIGYFMGSAEVGTSYDLQSREWRRNCIDISMNYFSYMLGSEKNPIRTRQFFTLKYTHGWNRDYGTNEVIRFTEEDGLRGLQENSIGYKRLIFSTETVMFTPLQPLGFRTAFFIYGDFGTLGMNQNPFRNEFFAATGIGIRMSNERFTFGAVELRLGVALNKNGFLNYENIHAGSISQIEDVRYIPDKPEVNIFR